MDVKSITNEMRTLRERKKELAKRGHASNHISELRKINDELEELNQEIIDLEIMLDEQRAGITVGSESQLEARGTGSPVGPTQILATYGVGAGISQNSTDFRSDDKMQYPNEVVEQRASKEYYEAFYKTVMGQGTPEQRALVTTATGSAVIPTSTFNQVVENTQKAAGLIGLVRVLEIPGKLTIPQSDINTPAAWHTEGAEINDSNLPPGSVSLTGYELAKLFSMSAATQSMSIAAFEQYLVQELSRCTRDALADAVINGTGTGQPTGILNGFTWDATNSVTIPLNQPALEYLTEAMALLPANFRQSAVWSMNSKTFYSYIAIEVDANGNPIFSKDLQSGLATTLLGKTVIIDDYIADNVIVFGNPSFYFLNFSSPMSVERSSDAGFTKGSIMFRSLAVVDGKPVAPAFVKVTRTV